MRGGEGREGKGNIHPSLDNTSCVANPSALRNAKWSDTRAIGYFVDVIRGSWALRKGLGLSHSLVTHSSGINGATLGMCPTLMRGRQDGSFLACLDKILGRWVGLLDVVWVDSTGLALGKTLTHATPLFGPIS